MNESFKTVAFAGVFSLIFLAGCWLVGNQPVEVQIVQNGDSEKELGGTRFPNGLTSAEFTQGGGVNTIVNSDGTYTATEADLLNYSVIRMTGSDKASATTMTLPATSTMTSLLVSAGDYRTWVIENGFTAAATTTLIAAGTGIDLQEPDGQNVVIGINNYAFLTCFREVSMNVVCRVDETIPAD